MSFEEMVVALVGAIGAFALVGYLATKVIDLIKTWINRKQGGYDEETFNRLAKAFMQHKKDTERRLQNLEAIIAEEDTEQKTGKQLSEPRDTIEIDEEKPAQDRQQDSSKLKNMLKN
ncbi:hypothetical protein ACG2F4_01365 [Halalkalibaculum sp. DA3122]|uniref:hypothetical protein n=1 Tax=unclassified Halalkalibaculum TaxID=2964617 RepID=UPI003754A906